MTPILEPREVLRGHRRGSQKSAITVRLPIEVGWSCGPFVDIQRRTSHCRCPFTKTSSPSTAATSTRIPRSSRSPTSGRSPSTASAARASWPCAENPRAGRVPVSGSHTPPGRVVLRPQPRRAVLQLVRHYSTRTDTFRSPTCAARASWL